MTNTILGAEIWPQGLGGCRAPCAAGKPKRVNCRQAETGELHRQAETGDPNLLGRPRANPSIHVLWTTHTQCVSGWGGKVHPKRFLRQLLPIPGPRCRSTRRAHGMPRAVPPRATQRRGGARLGMLRAEIGGVSSAGRSLGIGVRSEDRGEVFAEMGRVPLWGGEMCGGGAQYRPTARTHRMRRPGATRLAIGLGCRAPPWLSVMARICVRSRLLALGLPGVAHLVYGALRRERAVQARGVDPGRKSCLLETVVKGRSFLRRFAGALPRPTPGGGGGRAAAPSTAASARKMFLPAFGPAPPQTELGLTSRPQEAERRGGARGGEPGVGRGGGPRRPGRPAPGPLRRGRRLGRPRLRPRRPAAALGAPHLGGVPRHRVGRRSGGGVRPTATWRVARGRCVRLFCITLGLSSPDVPRVPDFFNR